MSSGKYRSEKYPSGKCPSGKCLDTVILMVLKHLLFLTNLVNVARQRLLHKIVTRTEINLKQKKNSPTVFHESFEQYIHFSGFTLSHFNHAMEGAIISWEFIFESLKTFIHHYHADWIPNNFGLVWPGVA